MARRLSEQTLLAQAFGGQEIAFGRLVECCYIKLLHLAFVLYGRSYLAKDKIAFVFAATRSQLGQCQTLAQYEKILFRRLIFEYLRGSRTWDDWSWRSAFRWPVVHDLYSLPSHGGDPLEQMTQACQAQHAIRVALAPLSGMPRVAFVLLMIWQLPMIEAAALAGCFSWRLRRAYAKAQRQLARAGVEQQVTHGSGKPAYLQVLEGHGP